MYCCLVGFKLLAAKAVMPAAVIVSTSNGAGAQAPACCGPCPPCPPRCCQAAAPAQDNVAILPAAVLVANAAMGDCCGGDCGKDCGDCGATCQATAQPVSQPAPAAKAACCGGCAK